MWPRGGDVSCVLQSSVAAEAAEFLERDYGVNSVITSDMLRSRLLNEVREHGLRLCVLAEASHAPCFLG